MPQSNSPAVDAASMLLATSYFDGRGPNYLRTVGTGTDIGAVEYNPLNFLVDELTDGAGTTLQEAITAANANPGHDTITFSSGLDFSAAVDITLSAELDVTGDLTIIGPGADQLTISGNDTYRILDLAAGTNVRLVGLTLTGGSAAGAGGAIRALGDELTLEECQILDSTATTDGGGIYTTGRVNLLESSLSGNSATDGGALMLNGASAFIRQSTISGNSATNGAAIALETSADATIVQSTIANNTAIANGGGLKITSSNVLLQNTLVADNSATTAYPDVDGTVLADSSYNLISDGTGMSGISDGTLGNQVGTSASPIDAKLGQLRDHGGPVQTVSLRVDSPALDAGYDDLALTRPGRSSSVVYDALGRVVQQIATAPDGIGSQETPITINAYDAAGRLVSVTDPLGSTTTNVYDNLGRKISTTDAESGCTAYTYDAAGRMASLTDPENNTTTWNFDPLGRVATETITVSSTDLTRSFEYDARGNLVRKIDRNGRVLDYTYDSLSRQTTEKWYNNLTDADVPQNVQKTYATTYDEAGRVASIGDGDYDFDYTYSIFGNLTSTTQDLTGLTDDVEFSYAYDVLGRKTSVSAAVGSTDDYVNGYSYDALGRITEITQDGVTGGNAVAEKRVDFGYSDDGTRATISRFADLAGTKAVAETEKVFDELGRVTDIVHERAATDFADYDLTWDAAGRITDFDFDSLVGDDGDAAYSYDDTNQLTASDYASDWQTDESYTYDDNGNRTNTGYTTGDHNRLTSDGTYNFTYDNEGNVLTKTNISTSESVEYTWDHRNRLTKVTFKNSGGTATEIIEYAYDHGQRWVRKTLDTNADGTIESSQVFVHDNGQIVLDFQKTGTTAASNSDLANRYLWGTNVDELLTDEAVDDGSEDDNRWALTDHLNSVRDLVVYNPVTGTVSVVKHVAYDAFGNVTSDSAAAVKSLFLYTARPFDADTDLQNNLNRWYDLSTGRWMSVDPIGFAAGDANLYRYVGNDVLRLTDPTGLLKCTPGAPQVSPPSRAVATAGGLQVDFSLSPTFYNGTKATWLRCEVTRTITWVVTCTRRAWFTCWIISQKFTVTVSEQQTVSFMTRTQDFVLVHGPLLPVTPGKSPAGASIGWYDLRFPGDDQVKCNNECLDAAKLNPPTWLAPPKAPTQPVEPRCPNWY
jgi:RHS repeat-associated protein